MGGSGGALGELWEAQGQLWEALAELREALGELWEGLYIQKLPINRPSGRYVNIRDTTNNNIPHWVIPLDGKLADKKLNKMPLCFLSLQETPTRNMPRNRIAMAAMPCGR